jgi:predicted acylesterase/phospholipase RssA
MSSPHAHRLHRSSYLCLLLFVGLTACQTIPTKTYEVRQRAFTHQPSSLVRDYQEEYAYIQERRETAGNGQTNGASDCPPPAPPAATIVPANLTGLAFSGGGIRSATFHLGLLRALHDM